MIEITRGDTKSFKFQRKNTDGEVIKAKADEVTFSVKENYYTKVAPITKKLSRGEIQFDDEAFYHFKIEHDDTKDMPYGSYVFDIEVKYNDEVKTPLIDTIKITEEVTFDDE